MSGGMWLGWALLGFNSTLTRVTRLCRFNPTFTGASRLCRMRRFGFTTCIREGIRVVLLTLWFLRCLLLHLLLRRIFFRCLGRLLRELRWNSERKLFTWSESLTSCYLEECFCSLTRHTFGNLDPSGGGMMLEGYLGGDMTENDSLL